MSIGGSSSAVAFDPRSQSVMFEDFQYEGQTNLNGGPGGFSHAGANGGGLNSITGTPNAAWVNHQGIVCHATGGTSNSTGYAYMEAQNSRYYPGQCTQQQYDCCVYTSNALSDGTTGYRWEIGFRSNSTNSAPPNAMMFVYDQTVSTNWFGYTANNTTGTQVTTSDTTFQYNINSWYTLRMIIKSASVDFYVANDTGSFNLLGTSTTNLPDASHTAWMSTMLYKTTSSATTRAVHYDYIQLQTQLTR